MCIVLFGSKARGDDNLLSDFDLFIIMENKIKMEADFPADIFCYTTREVLDEIEKGNTIVLDPLTQGKLILDNMNIFKSFQEKARNKINRDKLIRLKMGWFRVH
ncbi:MAG: nucleotidyltransferase domain-containing protein [Thermoplasmata archaeon]|nr:nucleotidyltransferase domain-containing protein [Thermoplasmata archaeon]